MHKAADGNRVEVLALSGKFDFHFFREFRNMYEPLLEDKTIHTLEIDLGRIDYIDSSALGMLLLLRDKAEKSAKKVVLSNCKSDTLDVLETAQFNQLFELH